MSSTLKAAWTPKKLNQLGFVGRGKSKHRPRNDPSLYGGDYPFIQTGEVKAADMYITDYSQSYNEKGLIQSKLWEPGTLCITIAANIAETAILKIQACFPDSIVGFIENPDESDTRFIKYYIDTIKLSMQSISRGTTQDNLSLDKLLTFDFLMPPLPTQQKIASILSAYDDLIENNTRRIKILEEMAQLIYQEWFVNFRFPGYEQVKMVDSELGKIPEGWEVIRFSDIANLTRKGINPGKYEDETFIHYSIPAFDAGCIPTLEQGRSIKSTKYLVSEESILLSKLNPRIPRVWLPFSNKNYQEIASTEFLVIEPKKTINRAFLFIMFQSSDFSGKFTGLALGTSTSHQRVKPNDFLGMNVLLPPNSILEYFDNLASDILSQTNILRLKNANLRQTRDLLLPKLISGEIDVEALDIGTGAEEDVPWK